MVRSHVLRAYANCTPLSAISSLYKPLHLDVLEDTYTWLVLYPRSHPSSGSRLTYASQAEWAIARLQAEAGQKLDIMRREEKHDIDNGVGTRPIASKQQTALVPSTDSGLPDSDASKNPLKLGRYRCMSLKHQGHLCLDTVGVAFVTLTTSTIRWSVKFEDMSSMRKVSW